MFIYDCDIFVTHYVLQFVATVKLFSIMAYVFVYEYYVYSFIIKKKKLLYSCNDCANKRYLFPSKIIFILNLYFAMKIVSLPIISIYNNDSGKFRGKFQIFFKQNFFLYLVSTTEIYNFCSF